MFQPVGFVTFSSRDSAEAARQALQVNTHGYAEKNRLRS